MDEAVGPLADEGVGLRLRVADDLLLDVEGRHVPQAHRLNRRVDQVLGRDARRDRLVRGRIGLVPQQDALFDRLSAGEFVSISARAHGMVEPERRSDEALALVDLDPDDPKPVGAYSKGMRQRVKVAAGLVNQPDVLILDEPLSGLDPVQRQRMIELFHELGDDGCCVLVSSHVLDEVARLGSRILVIAQGRLAATQSPHQSVYTVAMTLVKLLESDAIALPGAGYQYGVVIGVRDFRLPRSH